MDSIIKYLKVFVIHKDYILVMGENNDEHNDLNMISILDIVLKIIRESEYY